MTGLYAHRNGAEGFQPSRNDVPTLQAQLLKAGYYLGIFSKVPHLAPIEKFCSDAVKKRADRGRGPQRYYREATAFFAQAKQAGRPYFLMADSYDPHCSYADRDDEKRTAGKTSDVTRRIKPEEA